ncbi:MAG: FadR family transcriptional regulator [Myxococcota bacterium]|nr:FadR family transcriptional regulator [Myxococcota bacterium]
MPIQTIENHRLFRQIAAQLAALISSGELRQGQRLPSERELAAQLGVSRPSVREALIALEIQGKVEVRVGSGIFVASARPTAPSAISDPASDGQGPFELLRARWLIEGEIAAEAARAATADELGAVRSAWAEMDRRQHRNLDTDTADRDFHLRIAMATHNSALVSVVHDLWDRGRGAIWKRMEHHFQTPELRAAALRDHRAVLVALEAGDARAARTAMRQHLERVDRDFNRGWELLKERESASRSARTGPSAPLPAATLPVPLRPRKTEDSSAPRARTPARATKARASAHATATRATTKRKRTATRSVS